MPSKTSYLKRQILETVFAHNGHYIRASKSYMTLSHGTNGHRTLIFIKIIDNNGVAIFVFVKLIGIVIRCPSHVHRCPSLCYYSLGVCHTNIWRSYPITLEVIHFFQSNKMQKQPNSNHYRKLYLLLHWSQHIQIYTVWVKIWYHQMSICQRHTNIL